jgi:hypothetical protein
MASNESFTATTETWISGEADIVTAPMVIASGNSIAARTVLGQIAATGKLIPAVVGAVDGSDVPVAINVEAIDASAADVTGPVYLGGVFNPALAVWDASFTVALQQSAFVGSNIALVTPGYSG